MNQAAMMKIRKMQKEMMDAQKRIAETVFTGKSGGGMVEIQMTGEHEVKSVKIDPEALESKEDIEMIEDSLVAAFDDAIKQIERDSTKSFIAFGYSIPRIILPCLEVQRIHQVIFQFHAQFA